MKYAIAQLNYIIGDFEGNSKKIISSIQEARKENIDLIIFSELCVCGYPPLDLLEHKSFIERCNSAIRKIAENCINICAIIGAPEINPGEKGKNLFNSAFLIENKIIKKIFRKSLLPTYDIFDEYRYFEPNTEFGIFTIKNIKVAITICEDLWFNQPIFSEFGKSKLYSVNPVEELLKFKPDILINIAASPFSYIQENIKKELFTDCARNNNLPIIYVNQIGAHTELIFDGGSMIISNKGEVIKKLKTFEEDYITITHKEIISKQREKIFERDIENIEMIHDALILGIKDYFFKMNLKTAAIGLSGGIDSAVTLVLAVRALGNKNVRVLLLPSKYSSDHSVSDALHIANNLNIQYDIISIENIVNQFDVALKPIFNKLPSDLTEENLQARIRGNLLMAISNKFGNILLNTSNKSEAAVGYGTLYGDMSGGLSVLGDVYKTDVYKLANFINSEDEIIPENTIKKAPSAELRPNQKDIDSLPEYDVLDKILYHYIELKKSAEEIVELGMNEKLVRNTIHMVYSAEFKRYQTPPILRISSKAFGMGRRMPLVAKYTF